MTTRCLTAVLLVLAVLPAFAQVDLLHPERLGALYVSAAPDEYVDVLVPPGASTPFEFYLVADVDFGDVGDAGQNIFNGIQAWEAQVSFPPILFVLAAVPTPETSINVGTSSGNVYDFVVGTGARVAAGGPVVLVTFQGLLVGVPSGVAQLGPVGNPSVANEAVWVEWAPVSGCTLNGLSEACQFRFASLGDMRFAVGIPTDATTFGAMKSRF